MSCWFALKAPPVWYGCGDMLAIGEHEILIAPMTTERGRYGKGLLFLIGGTRDCMQDVSNEHIRIYDVFTNEWSMIKEFEMNVYSLSAALSYNEEYIIIAGGTKWADGRSKYLKSIYILDIIKFRKSAVDCPRRGYCLVARCGGSPKDKLLVSGYIRREFGCFLSEDVAYYMSMWFDQEMIHWIDNDNKKNHLCNER